MGVLVVDACRGAKTAAACVPVDAAWETLTDHQFCCALRQWKSDPDRCDVEKGPSGFALQLGSGSIPLLKSDIDPPLPLD
jgi:hypothetical protein